MYRHTDTTEQEDRERAVAAATGVIRAHYDDPEAWVRLAFSENGEESVARVYHFDAFAPAVPAERLRVVASCGTTNVWEAVLVK